MDKYKVLTFKNFSYKHFICEDSAISYFNVDFVENKKQFLHELSKEDLCDAIIIDIFCVRKAPLDFVKDVKQTLENNTAAEIKRSEIPFVFIEDGLDEELQIQLLEAGVTNILSVPQSAKLFNYKITRLIQKSKVNEVRIATLEMLLKTEINWMNNIDAVTGIYNEETFLKKTRNMIRTYSDRKFALLRFDIDRFKVFNELFGFEAGNELLESIGDAFRKTERPTATYGHLYADNFIVCIEANLIDAPTAPQRIADFLQPLQPNFEFVVRVGIYVLDDPTLDLSIACDRTLLALRSAKKSYTNRVAYYNDDMLSFLKDEQSLTADMALALERSEFAVYLQPQYDYATRKLIGAEALVRWIHPTKGLIPPGVFVPLFERNGFITQLDECIWDKTCALIRDWIDKGLNPVPVSVNISRRDIYQADLVGILVRLLGKYRLTPDNLRLEITESASIDNPQKFIKIVERLRNIGFCVEMDDFGSGYSSLNTLKDMPIDIIKLDMKFIMDATTHLAAGMGDTSKSGIILNSVINMANWLQMPVIAEGIETKEQADYLRSIGCLQMQGYYFARPMPSEQYEKLLTNIAQSDASNNTHTLL